MRNYTILGEIDEKNLDGSAGQRYSIYILLYQLELNNSYTFLRSNKNLARHQPLRTWLCSLSDSILSLAVTHILVAHVPVRPLAE